MISKYYIWVGITLMLVILQVATAIAMPKGNADIMFVRAVETDKGVWTFHVTVSHPDTGWKDDANGWDVVLPDKTVLKTNPFKVNDIYNFLSTLKYTKNNNNKSGYCKTFLDSYFTV